MISESESMHFLLFCVYFFFLVIGMGYKIFKCWIWSENFTFFLKKSNKLILEMNASNCIFLFPVQKININNFFSHNFLEERAILLQPKLEKMQHQWNFKVTQLLLGILSVHLKSVAVENLAKPKAWPDRDF